MYFSDFQLKILVNRDSICMGDDIENHQQEFIFDKGTTLEDFSRIVDLYFLPKIDGEWRLMAKTGEELLVYKPINCVIEYIVSPEAMIEDFSQKGELLFYHRYYN